MKNDYSAYILTGGKSSRMGNDKAVLEYNTKAFTIHIYEKIKALHIPCSIISSHKQHESLNITCIKDKKKNIGPIGGVLTALSETDITWNIILSCDIPLISKNSIQWLIDQHNKEFDATIPVVNDKINPLFGIYNMNCKEEIEKQILNKNYKMVHLLNNLNVHYIKANEIVSKELFNVNTPEDFNKLKEWK